MDYEIFEKYCYEIWDLLRSPELRALSPTTDQPSTIQYLSFVLSIIICIIGFAANLLVIFVTGFLMKKNKYKIWFLNLALADFTFLLFLPLKAVSIIRGRWPFWSIVCKLYNFLTFVNMYAGIYILTVLNIDRALSVAKPIWHLRFHSPKFCCFICALIWVSSAICSTPAIIYSDVHEEDQCTLSYYDTSLVAYVLSYRLEEDEMFDEPRERCANLSDFSDSEISEMVTEWRERTVTTERIVVPLAVVGYVIPLCVIVSCNIIIAFRVKNSMKMASSRLYRLVIIGVMSFFCTRTPYVLTYITFLVCVYTMNLLLWYKLSVILQLLFTIAATNSCLNPVIYVLVIKQARSEFLKFFGRNRQREIKRCSTTSSTHHYNASAETAESAGTLSDDNRVAVV
ncbi:C5a anaphylatoxin chemotactic receptor 1-like [Anomaloglossus baeobatrachus]|uniref:C5a anaphylatoxin chemotactic receptor 1-like n=1 Tax=Anomaloglossus baeobatrachus TaxID=238106 RepID=UPI003F4F9CB9